MTRSDRFVSIRPQASLARFAVGVLALWCTHSVSDAQVGTHHDGWYVAGSFSYPAGGWPHPGPSGVFLVHSRSPGSPIPITGLPSGLVGSTAGGVWSMVRRASDGALVVSEVNVGLGPARIHELWLGGTAVVATRTNSVGDTQGVTSVACLPDGSILIGAGGMVTGPMAGRQLGILDPVTGNVTGLPTSLSGSVEGVAVDASGTTAYVIVNLGSAGPGELHSVTLPGGQPSRRLAIFVNRPRGVAVDNDGLILVATHHGGGGVFVVDPATPGAPPTPLPQAGPGTGGRFAITIERATGNYVLGHVVAGETAAAWMTTTSAPNVLTSGPPGGWGTLKALVALDNPRVVGAGAPAAGTYSWAVAPNPGALPTLGNAAFSLTWTANGAAPSESWLFASTSESTVQVPIPGLPAFLQNPIGPFAVAGATIPIPVPPIPALLQQPLFWQTVHVDAGGVATSDVLRLSVQ